MKKLHYLSVLAEETLFEQVGNNLARYRGDGFRDCAGDFGWNLEMTLEADFEPLEKLSFKPEVDSQSKAKSDFNNSLLVWKALHILSPSLAREKRFWARLSHVECFEYTKARWLSDADDEKAAKSIRTHFFARGLTGCRDDNSLGRLWWSAYIAKMALPSDQERALELIYSSADVRSNLIERPGTASRPIISAAILRALSKDSWLTDREINFRAFMKDLNLHGGGLVFEALGDDVLEAFMASCIERAKAS